MLRTLNYSNQLRFLFCIKHKLISFKETTFRNRKPQSFLYFVYKDQHFWTLVVFSDTNSEQNLLGTVSRTHWWWINVYQLLTPSAALSGSTAPFSPTTPSQETRRTPSSSGSNRLSSATAASWPDCLGRWERREGGGSGGVRCQIWEDCRTM